MSVPDLALRAVFISYASQDAEVAKAICAALRSAGIEVWFDQSELRGGDAWDSKIRRQIKECALFMPLITANTNSRPEGYFRLEWKLAVDRSHLMADDAPFLFPIVVGDLTDATARVPDKFREVQWTRLRLDETPAELAARVARLLGNGQDASDVPRPAAPGRDAAASSRAGRWQWWMIFPILGTIMGLMFAAVPLWKVIQGPTKRSPAAPPVTAPAAPVKDSTAPRLDSARVALARFENLSGDPGLDGVARIIEGELVRGIAAAPHVRLVPVEAAGRTAARTAARQEKAATVILGSYYRDGANLLVSTEVVLVDSGTLYGSVGPVAVPAGVRGEAWTELVERLTTGANNAQANLESEPLKIAGLIYSRPWPRWPVAQQLQRLRAADDKKTAPERVEALRALLAGYPELLLGKLDLARLLRDAGRVDEAEQQFNELLAQRSQLSEAEIYAITYDLALLQGKPEIALEASRGTLAIRDNRAEITQVIASYWALNRPRMAYEAVRDWWEKLKPRAPKEMWFLPEVGVMSSRVAADLARQDFAAAETHAAELRAYTASRQVATVSWVGARVYAMQGKLEPLKAVIAEAGAMPADARTEPALLAYAGQGILRHRGFAPEAAALDAFIVERLASLPESVRDSDQLAEVNWHVAMLQQHYDEALQKLDDYRARQIAPPVDLLGYRALTLLKQGREAEWRALDEQLEKAETRNARGLTYYWRARLAAANGERKRATDLLEQAIANGLWFRGFQGGMSDLGRTEPEFAPLRGYAPYELLLKPKD